MIDQDIRLHFRIELSRDESTDLSEDCALPAACVNVDISVPRSSALVEVIPDILSLAGVEVGTTPWQSITASGLRIDASDPLHTTGLPDGAVVLLRPRQASKAPVVRDSAETLAHSSKSSLPPRGIAAATELLGIVGCACLIMRMNSIGLSEFRWLILCGLAALAYLWTRNALVLVAFAAFCACAAFFFVVDFPVSEARAPDIAAAVLAANFASIASSVSLHLFAFRRPSRATTPSDEKPLGHLRCLSAIISCALSTSPVAAVGLLYQSPESQPHGWFLGAASAVIVCSLTVVVLAPTLAVKLAGVQVPRLPSAGEDLSVADSQISAEHLKYLARKSLLLMEGILMGASASATTALLVIGYLSNGNGYACGLCVCAIICSAAHSHRHATGVSVWMLWLIALGGIIGLSLAIDVSTHWLAIVSLSVSLCALTASLWAKLLPRFTPVTALWIGRCEALALAAVFPLSCQLIGVFSLIRGLG
ncbi:type VII secretion integral membrane protein EccD [Corynebacterium pseudotuberculosis]|uniref:Type VII secretion integral membrane protein EccD n=1 Tax=Corynebacterium pseudotuberculosis 258 TaxID=1168865 RepID=A0AAU8PJH8_CORPS|nr:type VII secretion integral membrane protein EccD [Corynebacterium pseudotuberculosis]AEQ05963.1 type VII secretion integral membrane protein EccD [Corynebacterium pseudotuberculosis CIP 52.97]AFK16051.1 type VII secretion integral membrane protein EccD [Corynebacterium pseudotuberculosis 258]AKS12758.1 Hypothetical protein CpE19_0417 [Corynebacterium pseudotuberculosis]KEX88843.1 hypothetical protein CPTD_00581 [Corynebacterium pseudotuberculosis]UTO24868.1 type VII secretion integral memb